MLLAFRSLFARLLGIEIKTSPARVGKQLPVSARVCQRIRSPFNCLLVGQAFLIPFATAQRDAHDHESGVISRVPRELSEIEGHDQPMHKSGWKPLWDGKTTQGWRAIYQNQFPESGWIIENGNLICLGDELPKPQRGGAIITEQKYGSFELVFEFKIKPGGNSGIKYFVDERLKASRGHGLGLEYAIMDDENFPYADKEAKRTCGSLYDLVKAAPGATRPVGAWNQGRIVVQNNRVEHWLNGQLVVEIEKGTSAYRALVAESKYRNIAGWGEFTKGHVLIQDEGPRSTFRNIMIRELDQ